MSTSTFNVQIHHEKPFPLFSAQGLISSHALLNLADQIRSYCDLNDSLGVIIDCSAIEGALKIDELFFATQEFVKRVGLHRKIAYINPPASWKPEDDQFSRDVAQNRGMRLECFDDLDQAIGWLNSPA